MSTATYSTASIIDIERTRETLVVIPRTDLSEFEYRGIEAGDNDVFALLKDPRIVNVVVDLHRTDYFGSTALGFFLHIWKRVQERNGQMVLCNVSEHEKDVLTAARLDRVWPICDSLKDALRLIRSRSVRRAPETSTEGG